MFCRYCGKQLPDDSRFCSGCGKLIAEDAQPEVKTEVKTEVKPEVTPAYNNNAPRFSGTAKKTELDELVQEFCSRVTTNAIIWVVIAGIQLFAGLLFNWILLIVGGLNLASSISDFSYAKRAKNEPDSIVGHVQPLFGPIVTLIYNVVFGGLIGIAGSIFYLAAVRGFVMKNKDKFLGVNGNDTSRKLRFEDLRTPKSHYSSAKDVVEAALSFKTDAAAMEYVASKLDSMDAAERMKLQPIMPLVLSKNPEGFKDALAKLADDMK